jgi:hypothetical protein
VGDREHRDTLGADGVERLDLGAVVRGRIGGRDQPIGPLLVGARADVPADGRLDSNLFAELPTECDCVLEDGTVENLGRIQEDVHPMLDDLLRLRARRLLRDRFGGVDEARDVLESLTALLDELDEGTLDEPATDGRRTS